MLLLDWDIWLEGGKMTENFTEYSKKHIHFIDTSIPEMLESLLKELNERYSLIDLGCGDGRILYALHSKELLKNASRIVGVDISEERIRRLKEFCSFAEGIVSDVCDLSQIPNNSFDVVMSSQVIEHVPDDSKMLKEVYRILKQDGYFYISTVVKRWYGFWVYWNNGVKLDPTHVREYKSVQEFLNLLKENGFEIVKYRTEKVKYPMMDLIIRFFIKFNLIKLSSDFYQKHELLRKLRKIKMPVVGYRTIEVVARKI